MDPLNTEIAKSINRVFEGVRQTPGAPWEPERIFAFLTDPPEPKGRRARDSFVGRKYFVRFIESLQMEFGVCLTNKEWDRGFSLVELSELIEKKSSNRQNQHKNALNRLSTAKQLLISEPIKFTIIIGVLISPIWLARSILLNIVYGCICGLVTVTVVVFSLKELVYTKKLVARTRELMTKDDQAR